ncbi:MAG: SAM-dependent methyltransferase [Proteobacteria bacterium]|nr:SAM-dependent methyltransferase [Pseudomonadota bacterium]
MEGKTALSAWFNAQKIALGPIIFQAARVLRDSGILGTLRESPAGLTVEEIATKAATSPYAVLVLLEAGLAADIVRCDDRRYLLTPTGFYVLTDESTRINMDVVQKCCYQPAFYLEDSLRDGKPVGLQQCFGDWETIYPALSSFPEAARTSWLEWDHYYSDAAFPQALPIVFARKPRRLLDVGGNTGKWAIQCAGHCDDVSITILDLPHVVALADENIRERGLQERINTTGIDLLDASKPFPRDFDAIWMSQFLVCFSEHEVLSLLERAAAAMDTNARLYILDNFWDRQTYDIAAYCLQTFSLYFTFLANGRSRMYKASDITEMVEAAGMKVDDVTDNLGICSSLMICSKR